MLNIDQQRSMLKRCTMAGLLASGNCSNSKGCEEGPEHLLPVAERNEASKCTGVTSGPTVLVPSNQGRNTEWWKEIINRGWLLAFGAEWRAMEGQRVVRGE